MKVLFVALLFVAGTFARVAVQEQQIQAEGPACPIDDPLERPGPDSINVTLDPIAKLLEGSIRGDIVATGLSTLHYNVDINALLLTATFELTLAQVDVTTTYEATGYVDARPLAAETVPQGNFTGSGNARIQASGLKVQGSASLFVNIIGNKVTVSRLVLNTVEFTTLRLDLGAQFLIGGSPVDWTTWSDNIKANFDRDFAANKNAVVDKVRLAANNIVGQYTLAELIDLISGGGDGGEPCEN
ncbi:unnamed protein product [Orchesella dallaii]|uniref:Uncharacterized protein n=1 Tax=Orchesella dallaii TaxID=48710 RepID=A0ABP1QTR7_9HEXA